ncbi:hypothetical protein I4Q36_07415 [Tuanshanicoccus lijuaniae]|uniref:HipA family kinase n=1 Tax=Aerococcaceae bacterium zg-1292 TaxID=2774330 RepID=UPI001937CFA1|nr:hypothetical protein [Aerococcaceae bacterium zg-1292]QQA36636.1 hypothetical protein I4Q36_07415 [Aerococcaceae bacterium zg-1292]
MIQIENIIKNMKAGVTCPLLAMSTHGKKYVIKCIHDDCSAKILLNEYVCGKLADLLELPIAEHTLGYLPNSVINNSTDLCRLKAKSGTIFCSLYNKGITSMAPSTIQHISNKDYIPDMIAFDLFIGNLDRATNLKAGNVGNYLITNKFELLLIDHSHVFIHGEIWDKSTLKQLKTVGSTISENFPERYKYFRYLIAGRNPFDPIIKRIEEITSEDINNIFTGIPTDWEIPSEDTEALSDFLLFQIEHIQEIIEKTHEFFPKWKGGL